MENLDAIVAEADAVMVARGDQVELERDPRAGHSGSGSSKPLGHRARVPVITATQMLNSMEGSSRPTRAEASDVFNAVLDGTDAVMLSGETAIGHHPVEAVAMMSRIAHEAETAHILSVATGTARDLVSLERAPRRWPGDQPRGERRGKRGPAGCNTDYRQHRREPA